MLSQINRAIEESRIKDIPEVENLRQSLSTINSALTSAKEAISDRVMKMVQDGDVEGLYKIRPLVELISSEDPAKINVTLSSDLSNKRPKSVTFLGTETRATSWRGVTEAVLNILYSADKSGFANLVKSSEFKGKVPYYAKSAENMKAPVMLGSGAGVVYADVSRITNNDFLYLKKTIQALGHDASDVVIELDPDFQRKPITNRAKNKTDKKTKENTSPKNTKSVKAKAENGDTPKRRGRPKKATGNVEKQTTKKTTKTKSKTAKKESVSA